MLGNGLQKKLQSVGRPASRFVAATIVLLPSQLVHSCFNLPQQVRCSERDTDCTETSEAGPEMLRPPRASTALPLLHWASWNRESRLPRSQDPDVPFSLASTPCTRAAPSR